MSSPNPNNLSPVPNFPERGRVVVDRIIAAPKSNALHQRSGDRWAEEGLGFQAQYAGSFFDSVRDSDTGASHKDVEVQVAGQANGRSLLGSGRAVPAWDAVGPEKLAGFWQGTDASEQSVSATPFMHQPRAGANYGAVAPMHGFNAGSVPGTTYASKIAPANGGRGRVNIADVTEI